MKETIKKLMNEGLNGKIWQLLLVLSALGIFSVYIYYYAYFNYFNIDISFLKINSYTDLPNMIFLLFSFMMLALFILSSVLSSFAIYNSFPSKNVDKKSKKKFIMDSLNIILGDLSISYISFLFVPRISITYNFINFIAIILISLIKMIFIYFITICILLLKKLFKKKIKTFQKLEKKQENSSMPVFDTTMILFAIIFTSYILGMGEANLTKEFKIIESTNQVIIYNAGDYAIVCPYIVDEEKNVITIMNSKQIKISLENIELSSLKFKKVIIEESREA